ncbi:hypothetical protein D4100_18900 [Serratia inhibens]|uniref:Uncharacterized protein n=1 Tax=Serratia inhibens TaxID=2338073 RepID=A0AA93BY81_9GAMM|nr:hypothetical protein D4100_18900 [Serratia inhibens]
MIFNTLQLAGVWPEKEFPLVGHYQGEQGMIFIRKDECVFHKECEIHMSSIWVAFLRLVFPVRYPFVTYILLE